MHIAAAHVHHVSPILLTLPSSPLSLLPTPPLLTKPPPLMSLHLHPPLLHLHRSLLSSPTLPHCLHHPLHQYLCPILLFLSTTFTHTHRPRRPCLPASLYYGQRRQWKSRNNNNYVVNLSSKPLSRDTVNLLSKGLGYAPVPALQDRSNHNEDLQALARHLRIAYHFRNSRWPGKKHPIQAEVAMDPA